MSRELLRVAARCAVMLTVAGAVAGAVWLLVLDTTLALARRASESPGGIFRLPFDAALTAVCCLALTGCAVWLALVTTVVTLEALTIAAGQRFATPARMSPAARRAPRSSMLRPAALRRLALGCGGVALATGLACTPALADPGGSANPPASTPRTRLTGLVLPDRTPGTGSPVGGTVFVRRGDCLWSLAEQAMHARPDNTQIARASLAIQHANPDQIGDDPDLIFPGTALQIPDLDMSPRKESS